MSIDTRRQFVTREDVLLLLTDDEVAKVSTAETAARLADGEEYLDLEHLDLGVRRAVGASTPMGSAIPRKAVHEATWGKILQRLGAPPVAAKPSAAH